MRPITSQSKAQALNNRLADRTEINHVTRLILIILLVIFLLGGFSGRFGGYGYGYGHGGVGIIGIILIVVVVLLLMGRI